MQGTGCTWRVAASLVMALVPGVASAATTIEDFFNAGGFSPTRDYFSELPYEHIDPLTGNLLLTFTDLVLPGNAGLELRIQRTYNSKIYVGYPGLTLREDSWAGVGWTLHMGRIRNPSAGIPGPIEMPDGSQHELFTNSSPSGTFITRDFWIYDRSPASPVLKLTNGLVYTFGRSTTINGVPYRYVTRIDDTFGNHIDVSYTTGSPVDAITSIIQYVGSQTRTVTFSAAATNGGLSSMTYTGSRTYTWTYSQVAASSAGFNRLTQVQPPVGRPWQYSYDTAGAFIEELTRVITPSNGQIDYVYGDVVLNLGSTAQVTTPAVVSRMVSGPNLTTGTWTYAYAQGTAKNQTVITQPAACVSPAASVTTTYTFLGVGNNYSTGTAWNIGLVSSKVVKQGTSTLETTSLAWTPSVAISLDQQIVGPNFDQDTFVPLLDLRTITRGGRNYVTDFAYTTANFNDYGRANSIVETGDLSRTTTRTFDYAFTPYIKDRMASETVSVASSSFATSYAYDDSSGFKTSETIYGVTTTFAPTPNGNVQSATDARNNTTSFTYDWGVLKDVITPEYAPTATVSRSINPEGTVASETRRVKTAPGTTFTNATTSFQYDDLFRLTRRTPPAGSPVDYSYDNAGGAWTKVTRDPDGVGGVAPSVVENFLDGLGRVYRVQNSLPILSDTSRDACGQSTFVSYPYSGTPSPIPGSTYAYDGLGRVKSKTDPGNTSGTTVISYAYPTGVDVHITDEAGRITQQHWAAFGAPSEARLLSVRDAAGQTTAYSHSTLGNLTLVDPPGTSAQRSWVYNTKNQLTSETHPESGTTTYTYYPNGGQCPARC